MPDDILTEDDLMGDDEDELFELLDMDVREVSVVDRAANGTRWIAMKGLRPTATGDYETTQPDEPTKQTIKIAPDHKRDIRKRIAQTIEVLQRFDTLLVKAVEIPGEPLPDQVRFIVKMAGKLWLDAIGTSPEIEELDRVDKAIDSIVETDPSATLLVDTAKSAITKAQKIINDQRAEIAKLNSQLDKLRSRVRSSQAVHPERAPQNSQVNPQEPFPIEYRRGRAVGGRSTNNVR